MSPFGPSTSTVGPNRLSKLGYVYDETLQYDDWYAKVYRKSGYAALFVDQAYADERGKTSIIPGWVNTFGDKVFHHVAVRVEDIERAVARLQQKGVVFAGKIVGAVGGPLRQIFSAPETVDGQPFSVLELAERHRGYQGFLPPQADSLMKSSAPALSYPGTLSSVSIPCYERNS